MGALAIGSFRIGEMSGRRMVALLGRRDTPTDAVEDYCIWLGRALAARGYTLEPHRVPWAEHSWIGSLRSLSRESAGWRGRWVLVQYTALSWSRRGFPFGLLPVLFFLWRKGTRVAMVFHDTLGYPGNRLLDRLRCWTQHCVMRIAYELAERSVLAIPLERASWLPEAPAKAVFIPIGSNIPAPENGAEDDGVDRHNTDSRQARVAIFGITPGKARQEEIAAITQALKTAASRVSHLNLVAFGRGTKEAEKALRHALDGLAVDISVLGLLPASEVGRVLSSADVQLDVRDTISSRRGSAIAAIACGVPVVGYQGPDTDLIILQAGVCLVPRSDGLALGQALAEVIANNALREELRRRNRSVQQEFFAWNRIAARFLEALEGASLQKPSV